MKYFSLILFFILTSVASFAVAPITGPTSICTLGSATLSDATTSGVWSSSNTAIATVGSASGIYLGISAGTATITYDVSGIYATTTVTILASPPAMFGPSTVCAGQAITLTDGATGGSWSTAVTPVAVVGSSSGIVTGMSAGTAMVTYKLATGCMTSKTVTVYPVPAPITGSSYVCVAPSTNLTDATPGGTWSSSNTSVATVASGVVTGVLAGTTTVYYTLSTGCFTSKIMTVNPSPVVYSLIIPGGSLSYCAGGTGVDIQLSGSNTGFTYTLFDYGVSVGTLAGSGSSLDFGPRPAGAYAVNATDNTTGCIVSMSGTATLLANPVPVAYTVTGGGSYCAGGSGMHIYLNFSDVGVNYNLYDMYGSIIATLAGTNAGLDFGVFTSAGTYTVKATNTFGCQATMTGSAIISVTPLPNVYTLTGGGGYCAGGSGTTIGLSGSDMGVIYDLYAPAIHVAGPVTGTGTSISFGSVSLSSTGYYVIATNAATGCINTMSGTVTVSVNPLPTAYTVTGGGSYCSGGTGVNVGLLNSNTGVDYQLFNGLTAMGSTVPGTGSTINFGLQTVAGTYTVVATDATTGCMNNMTGSTTVIINPTVVPSLTIVSSPGDTVCPGTAVTFTATPVYGGITPAYQWSINGMVVAGVTSSTFSYIPANADVVAVTMTSTYPCVSPATTTVSFVMVVNLMPPVTGSTTVCIGATSSLTDAAPGGTWSSSDPTIASIATIGGYVGVTTGIAAGTSTLTYMLGTGCYAAATLTVLPSPTITASSSTTCGDNYILTASGGVSYSWSPSTGLSCSSCSTTTISPSATTTYTVTGTDASTCTNTGTVTINGDRIFGHITFSSLTPDTLDMKVWLVQFNPIDSSITALDSTLTCTIDSIGYFEFDSKPAGNYLVKAKLLYGATPGSNGYLPTYSLSTPNWYAAATTAHTGGSDSLHINMVYGTVPSGPGFIGGYVYSGAGKGTSGETAVPGMLIYLMDLGNKVLTYTYTDNTGAYSFSNLAYGDYIVAPEEYDYNTINSDLITLNDVNPSANAIVFKEYTTSRVIKPYTVGVGVKGISSATGLNIYPNPSNGTLSIQWQNQPVSIASFAITDVMGREVYKSTVNINAKSGDAQIDLSQINEGIYLVTIKSENINYSGKLLIRK